MDDKPKFTTEEDEDFDLDALRMAALQSLKKKASNNENKFNDKPTFYGSRGGKSNRGKFTRAPPIRNGQFNRNTNLISIPTINPDEKCKVSEPDCPKLILPQDRYCGKGALGEKGEEKVETKFDRYNESNSESEEDEDEEKATIKLRSNSLDDLMAELENELQVGAKEPPKPKETESPSPKKREIQPKIDQNETTTTTTPSEPQKTNPKRKWNKNGHGNYFGVKRIRNGGAKIPPPACLLPPPLPQPIEPFPMAFYNPPPLYQPPPVFEAIIQPILPAPLSINTSFGGVPPLGPLSPRSAAFVLQNRAIVEKRKRRSWSRSPSPRFRPKSPPIRRSSLSPKRQSLQSPKRRSLSPSPVRRVSRPVHGRLGTKPELVVEKQVEKKVEKEEEKLDPILEARRKKFERNEITIKEGVIRLKKDSENDETNEVVNVEKVEHLNQVTTNDDDLLLLSDDDAILLDVDRLFSDEESASDNEGRFKTKAESGEKVGVLPFRKLLSGKREEKKRMESSSSSSRHQRVRDERNRERRQKRSRTPIQRRVKKIDEKPIKVLKKVENKPRILKAAEKVGKEEKIVRKVEIAEKKPAKSDVIEIVEEPPNNNCDLRAQLSRKRAERQKHTKPKTVQGRLFENALQGVGVRKVKKETEVTVDGKLPIHYRLGTSKTSPERKLRKSKGSQEQV